MDHIYPDGFNAHTAKRPENEKVVLCAKKILQMMEEEKLSYSDAHKTLGFVEHLVTQKLLDARL